MSIVALKNSWQQKLSVAMILLVERQVMSYMMHITIMWSAPHVVVWQLSPVELGTKSEFLAIQLTIIM